MTEKHELLFLSMADARSIALVCANEVSLWAELQARASVVAQAEPALAHAAATRDRKSVV